MKDDIEHEADDGGGDDNSATQTHDFHFTGEYFLFQNIDQDLFHNFCSKGIKEKSCYFVSQA